MAITTTALKNMLTLSEIPAKGLEAPSSPALLSRALRELSHEAQSPFCAKTRIRLAKELDPPPPGSPLALPRSGGWGGSAPGPEADIFLSLDGPDGSVVDYKRKMFSF